MARLIEGELETVSRNTVVLNSNGDVIIQISDIDEDGESSYLIMNAIEAKKLSNNLNNTVNEFIDDLGDL